MKKEVTFENGPMAAMSEALLRRQIRKSIEGDSSLSQHADKSIDEKIAIKLSQRTLPAVQDEIQEIVDVKEEEKQIKWWFL